jgi:hypothetical protein
MSLEVCTPCHFVQACFWTSYLFFIARNNHPPPILKLVPHPAVLRADSSDRTRKVVLGAASHDSVGLVLPAGAVVASPLPDTMAQVGAEE